jgi:hypothetical protein
MFQNKMALCREEIEKERERMLFFNFFLFYYNNIIMYWLWLSFIRVHILLSRKKKKNMCNLT